MQPHISFIGVGNMATAIISGLISSGYPIDCLTGTARSPEKRRALQTTYGFNMIDDNTQAVAIADIVVLCVKPAQMQEVIAQFKESVTSQQLYISVAAGIELNSFKDWLGQVAIIRSMPNTPSQVGAGMTGLIANDLVTPTQQTWCQQIFDSIGQTAWLTKEQDMHTVTALSGSSPAYFFRFLEAMIQTGQQQGLDQETSRKLACQAMLGAARMATEIDEDIAQLRKNITSPNGTTEQALLSFEANNIGSIIDEAMTACSKRSQEMTQLFSTTSEQKG